MEKMINGYKVKLSKDLVTIYDASGNLLKGMTVNANQAIEGFNAICERVKGITTK